MNDTLLAIHSMSSTHGGFTDRQISSADLKTVLEASVRAANSSFRQSYSIVVVDDRSVMRKLTGYEADKCLIYCVDFNRLDSLFEFLGCEEVPRPLNIFVAGLVDTALAAQNAAIAARSLGIDSLFTNGLHRVPIEEVYRTLNLPKRHCFPLIALLLGYSNNTAKHSDRLSGKGIIHENTYHDLTRDELSEMVASYDDPQLHLRLTDEWASGGASHYLVWLHSRDSRRMHPAKETELVDCLVGAGFLQQVN